ncbi:uncharacterized protein LOC126823410 [Patella vulgata]|uniref:uncharacterized protein LOC126823410 n=1 Tax=Patella vulgata TaxID=6465 RepID=UPI00218049F0|nr:uncharacterized protein LOC126823410 [Patella vulgata]XP_050408196.1 uncharacterized protein LOC126823410 [Patella vulgata]
MDLVYKGQEQHWLTRNLKKDDKDHYLCPLCPAAGNKKLSIFKPTPLVQHVITHFETYHLRNRVDHKELVFLPCYLDCVKGRINYCSVFHYHCSCGHVFTPKNKMISHLKICRDHRTADEIEYGVEIEINPVSRGELPDDSQKSITFEDINVKIGEENKWFDKNVRRWKDKYQCPLCPAYKIGLKSLKLIKMHWRQVHLHHVIKGQGLCFLPCFFRCICNPSFMAKAHYHCSCGLIKEGKINFLSHLRCGEGHEDDVDDMEEKDTFEGLEWSDVNIPEGKEVDWLKENAVKTVAQSLFVCALCASKTFEPCTNTQLRMHWKRKHVKLKVAHRGIAYMPCYFPCCIQWEHRAQYQPGKKAHYHCSCGKFIFRKPKMKTHLEFGEEHQPGYKLKSENIDHVYNKPVEQEDKLKPDKQVDKLKPDKQKEKTKPKPDKQKERPEAKSVQTHTFVDCGTCPGCFADFAKSYLSRHLKSCKKYQSDLASGLTCSIKLNKAANIKKIVKIRTMRAKQINMPSKVNNR